MQVSTCAGQIEAAYAISGSALETADRVNGVLEPLQSGRLVPHVVDAIAVGCAPSSRSEHLSDVGAHARALDRVCHVVRTRAEFDHCCRSRTQMLDYRVVDACPQVVFVEDLLARYEDLVQRVAPELATFSVLDQRTIGR